MFERLRWDKGQTVRSELGLTREAARGIGLMPVDETAATDAELPSLASLIVHDPRRDMDTRTSL